ncbi:MAG: class I SAM-dependent methyltransferase [Gammaproteobacteria bacterium]|nr:class I SAM-dependent methyltransferase [Gammaproteobacteria bacterium]
MFYNNNRLTKVEIIGYAFKLGFRSLLCGDFRIALKRIILPISYWRVTIFQLLSNFILNLKDVSGAGVNILDIGSPKLMSLLLGSEIKGKVHATDLCDTAIFSEWKKHYLNYSAKDNVIFEYANAKDLNYPDKYFDLVYSISVIHMITPADTGDIIALDEIQKKIRPGGYLLLEVPFRTNYGLKYVKRSTFEENYEGQPLFNERLYDLEAINTRLAANINGILLNKIFLYERLPFEIFWNSLPSIFRSLFAFIEPWVDVVNVAIATDMNNYQKSKSVVLIFRMD